MILSVSRRTDIPAFYAKWFINRIHEGYVYVRNPFNANQISNIPLDQNVVDCIVFWTKNPGPLMQYLPEISKLYDGAFYFQYTVNTYGKDMEPCVPGLERRVSLFADISKTYGTDRVVWRYDPILITDKYTTEWHIQSFKEMVHNLKGYTDTCVISFIDMYEKTKMNTREYGIRPPTIEEMDELVAAFSDITKGTGIQLKTCAEAIDFQKYGIEHNSCIDKDRIEKITGWRIKAKADKQRSDCQCIECADIGLYNTCLHGCRYCYANYNTKQVENAIAAHNDESPLLTGIITADCHIKDYSKAKSLKVERLVTGAEVEQISLF